MSNDKWDYIKTLINILHLFATLTQSLSRYNKPTINFTFSFYNILFNHIEDSINKFENNDLLSDILASTCLKLQYYYSKIENKYGFYYNLDTILDPWFKLSFYNNNVSETPLIKLSLHGIY